MAAVTALLSAAWVASPARASHAPPLAGQWHLDDVTDCGDTCDATPDSSGHGIHLEAYGEYSVVAGRFGRAFSVDPAEPLVAGDTAPLEARAVTLLGWVRRSGPLPAGRYIAAKGAGDSLCTPASYALRTGPPGTPGIAFSIFDGAQERFSPNGGTALWDGQWHMVAGTYDGARVRLYVDGVQIGDGTPAAGPIAYGLASRRFAVSGYPTIACGDSAGFPGDVDEFRVYDRALTATEIARLAAHPGPDPPVLVPDAPAAPPPPASPGPGGDSPAPPPPPVVTGVQPVAVPGRGGATVLRAAVQGAYTSLQWDLGGRPGPEITGDPGHDAVRFRALRAMTATVRAVGPGGASPPVTVQVAPAPSLAGAIARKVVARQAQRPPVYATGSSSDPVLLGRTKIPGGICLTTGVKVVSAGLEAKGCLGPVDSLDDLPAGERGIVVSIARGLGIPVDGRSAGTALRLSDAWVARASVTVNGVRWTPGDGAAVVFYPQGNALASSAASMAIGRLRLAAPSRFLVDLRARAGRIPLGAFGLASGGLRALGGFPLAGNVDVALVPSQTAPAAEITTSLRLPAFLRRGGVDMQGQVRLRATTDAGLQLSGMRVGPLDGELGALAIRGLQLDYDGAQDEWRGRGRLCLAGGACLDMTPPNGQLVIRRGRLSFAGASLAFPPPGIQLFPGVALERVGFGVGLDPTRLVGNAKVVAVSMLEIDGRLVLAFPSERAPYVFDLDEVGPGFPGHFYGRVHTRTTAGVAARALLRLPVVGSVPLGQAHLLYEHPGYVAFGGSVDQAFAGVISIHGSVSGELNATNGRFNLLGSVRGCLVDALCSGATGLVSSRGLVTCLHLGPVNVGGGVIYRPFEIKLWPLDGCKWSPFTERDVRAAQAGGAREIRIRPGDASRVVELRGAEAPRVRLTGPGGRSIETPAGSGFVRDGSLRIIRSEPAKLTVIGLQDPAPGVYRIEPLEGSPAITRVREATDPPGAKITARVTGTGTRRVLRYDVMRRPAQRVTFVEVGRSSRRIIGTVSGGGRGHIVFTPAPGRDRRRIEAQFELDGLPAERRTVARFTPPGGRLARPARLRVVRRGASLRASWAAVRGATRYEVVVTTADTRQRVRRTQARRLRLTGVPASTSGRVSVRALSGEAAGPVRTVRFRATARRVTRFGSLPRAPRGLR